MFYFTYYPPGGGRLAPAVIWKAAAEHAARLGKPLPGRIDEVSTTSVPAPEEFLFGMQLNRLW